MKDQEARNEIQKLRNDLNKIELGEYSSLKIEVCPNCKHDTLNAFSPSSFYFISSCDTEFHGDDYYRCLTCGVKWEYNKSPKIIKEKK